MSVNSQRLEGWNAAWRDVLALADRGKRKSSYLPPSTPLSADHAEVIRVFCEELAIIATNQIDALPLELRDE